MKRRAGIQRGTLALMVLQTLDVLGLQHGFGIARRVEQISGEQLARVGRKQLQTELTSWHQTADIIAGFLAINVEAPI
jgi:hypothetical protein